MTLAATDKSPAQANRDTLFLEDATLLESHEYPGQQFILRLKAPQCAARATAGSFVHVRCDETIPMRRPLSIMRAARNDGWIEVLFKTVGEGLNALAGKHVGDSLSVIGPIGRGFEVHPERPNTLLVGGGVGIPPLIFLAEQLHRDALEWQPLVLMGSELPYPFEILRSELPADWLPEEIAGTMPMLEHLGIPARLASLADFPDCLNGYVTDLARLYLESLDESQLARTELFACGPTPMLRAVATLARELALPCQVSLEEYMACAVGGCAGCTVLVRTDDGPAMQRVCVDGPVFDAERVVSFAED